MRFRRIIAYFFLVVILPFCAVEILLRLFDDVEDFSVQLNDQFDLRQPEPYIMFQPTADSDSEIIISDEISHVKTNSAGFRYDVEVPLQKDNGEIRIFMLGGSAVFNGLKNSTTIAGILEKRLQKHYPDRKIRCINTGIVSANSDQLLVLLVKKIVDFRPDIILVLDGFNDLNIAYNYEPRLGYPYNWVTIENAQKQNAVIRRAIRELSFIDSWFATSRIITKLNPSWSFENRIIQSIYIEASELDSLPEMGEIVNHLMLNWFKMDLISKGFGAKMVALLQPMNPKARSLAHYKPFYETANTVINKMRNENGLHFYSFDRILDPNWFDFYDVVHTRDNSHIVLAEKIEDLLFKIDFLPKK